MLRFQKGWPDADLTYPLTSIPVDDGSSQLVSPRIGNPHGLPTPSMPEDGAAFEEELNEVIEVRMKVMNREWPSDFLAKHHPRPDFDPEIIPYPLRVPPANLTTANPAGCANIVHMDAPWDLGKAVHNWIKQQRIPLKNRDHVTFLESIDLLDIAAVKGRACENLQKAFEAKYYFGRPRPEEATAAGGLSCFDPGSAITHYPEGCPNHPEYPAGHGAAAASVQVFIDLYDMSPEQENVVKDCAYHWAMFRTFAGVHMASGNLAGLTIGGLTL